MSDMFLSPCKAYPLVRSKSVGGKCCRPCTATPGTVTVIDYPERLDNVERYRAAKATAAGNNVSRFRWHFTGCIDIARRFRVELGVLRYIIIYFMPGRPGGNEYVRRDRWPVTMAACGYENMTRALVSDRHHGATMGTEWTHNFR